MTTSFVMSEATGSENTRSLRAAERTTSRSETIPTGLELRSTTTRAPILCSASSATACLTVCCGRMVITLLPLLARRLAMFM